MRFVMDSLLENLAISNEEKEDLIIDIDNTENEGESVDLCLVFNLPIGCFTEAVGTRLGNFIGTFLQYDDSNWGTMWKNYMCIHIEIDVSLPLKCWKKIKMGNGDSTLAEFKYEKLHVFCFICGKLDHIESFCDKLYESNGEDKMKG
ncbi:hypothetical protein ACS0TY_027726 [Phlomoides rotata]